jgi:hypothetical protein
VKVVPPARGRRHNSQQFSTVYPPKCSDTNALAMEGSSTFLKNSLVRRLVSVSDTVAAVMRVADIF